MNERNGENKQKNKRSPFEKSDTPRDKDKSRYDQKVPNEDKRKSGNDEKLMCF